MTHNMSGYDIHLIIKSLVSQFPDGNMTEIAENVEKYISASVNVVVEHMKDKTQTISLRFLDSFRFMQSSLDSLVRSLVGVSNLRCNCLSDEELSHIDISYVAHGVCKFAKIT